MILLASGWRRGRRVVAAQKAPIRKTPWNVIRSVCTRASAVTKRPCNVLRYSVKVPTVVEDELRTSNKGI